MGPPRKPMEAKYGKLTVIEETSAKRYGGPTYLVLCECGNYDVIPRAWLRGGTKTSCGCGRPRGKTCHLYKHGMSESPTWWSWIAMKDRCYRQGHKNYDQYGGKGVRVVDRWLGKTGFVNFLADMGVRPEGKTLDRKNPFGNYTPKNCKWSDKFEQANNKRASEKNRIYLVGSFDDPYSEEVVF